MKSSYLPQIDFLKAFAIMSVILMHTIRPENMPNSIYLFFIVQAVPIFLVITGFNWCSSFYDKPPESTYIKSYFLKKSNRLIKPFAVIFICSILLGLLQYVYFGQTNLNLSLYSFIGLLPIPGPGNYFFTIMLELIFIFPLLFLFYSNKPKYFLVVCFVINIVFELISPYLLSNRIYLYNASVLRFLFAIALGMWISKDYRLLSTTSIPVLIGSVFSIVYLLLNIFGNYPIPYFLSEQHTQNIFSFFYPALLVLVGLKYLPCTVSANSLNDFIVTIGKASYHIFLVQMFYFSVLNSPFGPGFFKYFTFGLDSTNALVPAINLLLNEAICIMLGLLFYRIKAENIIANIKSKIVELI